MQFGHAAVVLAIASYDWNWRTFLVVGFAHFLPNFDAFPILWGWADDDFHCSITHTFLFAIIVSLLFGLLGVKYGIFAFISLMAHYFVDLGSTVGMPLFMPFWNKRFSFKLWEHTGHWGNETIKGYYRQPLSWITEGIVVLFVIYRFWRIYS
jgi:hypothetical protein